MLVWDWRRASQNTCVNFASVDIGTKVVAGVSKALNGSGKNVSLYFIYLWRNGKGSSERDSNGRYLGYCWACSCENEDSGLMCVFCGYGRNETCITRSLRWRF